MCAVNYCATRGSISPPRIPATACHQRNYFETYSRFIVDYCQKVALATGISVFVIDRAVNAVAMARAFATQDLGLLCMLDDNEHHGLESFEATLEETRHDGTKISSGPWKMPRAD